MLNVFASSREPAGGSNASERLILRMIRYSSIPSYLTKFSVGERLREDSDILKFRNW